MGRCWTAELQNQKAQGSSIHHAIIHGKKEIMYVVCPNLIRFLDVDGVSTGEKI